MCTRSACPLGGLLFKTEESFVVSYTTIVLISASAGGKHTAAASRSMTLTCGPLGARGRAGCGTRGAVLALLTRAQTVRLPGGGLCSTITQLLAFWSMPPSTPLSAEAGALGLGAGTGNCTLVLGSFRRFPLQPLVTLSLSYTNCSLVVSVENKNSER